MPKKIADGMPFPLIKSHRHQSTIMDTEYIMDVYGTTQPYTQTTFRINPGIARSFPQLSSLCMNMVEYRMEQLEYCYKPVITSMLGSNPNLGYVGLSMVFDTSSPPFTDKQQFLQSSDTVSARSDQVIHLKVNLNDISPTKYRYVSQGGYGESYNHLFQPLNGVADRKMEDYGVVVVATGNNAVNDEMIGELYVKYKFSFRKIRPMGNMANNIVFANVLFSGDFTGSNIYGTFNYPQRGSNTQLHFTNNAITTIGTGSVIVFPDSLIGTFLLIWYYVGSETAWDVTGLVFSSNIYSAGDINYFNHNQSTPLNNSDQTIQTWVTQIDILTPGEQNDGRPTICLIPSNSTMVGSPTYAEFIMTQIPAQSSTAWGTGYSGT